MTHSFAAKFPTSTGSATTTPRPVSALGTTIRYSDGTECLDGISGRWNVPLGYGHRGVADAVHQALLDASYLSSQPDGHSWLDRADKMLLEVAGPGRFSRVLHTTSGSAALDAVIRLSRQYHALRGHKRRTIIVSLKQSFHGMTMGALSLTAADLGQADLGVDMRAIRHIEHHRTCALDQLLEREGDRIAAIVIEPVQNAGAVVVGQEFLSKVLAGRAEHGYLVAADEGNTGFGRTGPMFASQRWRENVDLLVASNGMTNGAQAASAVLIAPKVAKVLDQDDSLRVRGETHAGTPASCAAIMATITAFHDDDVLAQGAAVAYQLDERLKEITASFAGTGAGGTGCFRSLTLPGASQEAVADLTFKCLRSGAVVHPGPGCIQLVPALVYPRADLDRLMDRVRDALAETLGSRAVVAA